MAELGALTVAVRMSSDGIDKAMDRAGKGIDQGAAHLLLIFSIKNRKNKSSANIGL